MDSWEVEEVAKDGDCWWARWKERFTPSPPQQLEDCPEENKNERESGGNHHREGELQPKEREFGQVLKYKCSTLDPRDDGISYSDIWQSQSPIHLPLRRNSARNSQGSKWRKDGDNKIL